MDPLKNMFYVLLMFTVAMDMYMWMIHKRFYEGEKRGAKSIGQGVNIQKIKPKLKPSPKVLPAVNHVSSTNNASHITTTDASPTNISTKNVFFTNISTNDVAPVKVSGKSSSFSKKHNLRKNTTFYKTIGDSQATPSCTPKTHVAFMKTHKCASSTLQNILFRFGLKNNLNFAFPQHGHQFIKYKCHRFTSKVLPNAPWRPQKYDIITQHLIWHTPEIKRIMHNDSVYIGVIRDPVSVFESLYDYYNLTKFYGIPIQQYANLSLNSDPKYLRYRKFCRGRNQILYDFGVPSNSLDDRKVIENKIKEVENVFDLVLVNEYLYESLVLLKNLLCWDLDDVTFLNMNLREKGFKKELTDDQKRNLRRLNWGDQMFYDHFLEKHRKKVKKYGKNRMQTEVEMLKSRNLAIAKHCIMEHHRPMKIHKYKVKYKQFGRHLKPVFVQETPICLPYGRSEKLFTSLLRSKQDTKLKKAYNQRIKRG